MTPNEQLDKKLKMSQHDERADQTKLTSEMSELWIPPLRFSEQCLHLWERYLTDMDEVDIIDQKLQSIGDKIVSLNPGLCWRIFLFVSKGKNEKVERLKEEESALRLEKERKALEIKNLKCAIIEEASRWSNQEHDRDQGSILRESGKRDETEEALPKASLPSALPMAALPIALPMACLPKITPTVSSQRALPTASLPKALPTASLSKALPTASSTKTVHPTSRRKRTAKNARKTLADGASNQGVGPVTARTENSILFQEGDGSLLQPRLHDVQQNHHQQHEDHLHQKMLDLEKTTLYLERENCDLPKKLRDAQVSSKHQANELYRVKAELASEKQRSNRMQSQNDKLKSEVAMLKRDAKKSKASSEFVQWRLLQEESTKYLRLMEYLHQETFLEQSPTLARCIDEYRLVNNQSNQKVKLLDTKMIRNSSRPEELTPVGLTGNDFRTMTLEVDAKMVAIKAAMEQKVKFQLLNLRPPASRPIGDRNGVAMARPGMASGEGKRLFAVVDRVRSKFPTMTRDDILEKMMLVKNNNGGSVAEMTFSELIDQIRTVDSNSGSDKTNDECAICMEEMDCSDHLKIMNPCRHLFHRRCISAWLQSSRTCPCCRVEIVLPDNFAKLSKISIDRR